MMKKEEVLKLTKQEKGEMFCEGFFAIHCPTKTEFLNCLCQLKFIVSLDNLNNVWQANKGQTILHFAWVTKLLQQI